LYAAAALWRGDVEEFDRIREAGSRFANPIFNVLDLGLAPTREPMTSTLLHEAERMWREQPQHGWNRRWLGLAQLRAGQYREALASLEASLTPGNYWQEGDYFPLLAMAHHHLGNKEAARLWLDKTTSWLELWKEAESRRAGSNSGVGNTLPEYVLYALVFHREAKALIEGDVETP
jgi:tetratricopeptide (TPR) repeat protein